jgi:hypothetical protein
VRAREFVAEAKVGPVGKRRSAATRGLHKFRDTKQESDMLKQAYKATGSWHQDLNSGDMESGEVPSTNKISPVVAFKGYPR